jgi:hypothetical protein
MSPEVPLSRQQPRKPNSAIVHIKKKTIRHPMIDDEAVAGTDDEEEDEEEEEEDSGMIGVFFFFLRFVSANKFTDLACWL